MIVLEVQLKIFVGSVLLGWLYGLCYSCYHHLYLGKKDGVVRIVFDIVFQLCFHSAVFFCLFQLNGGILRVYYVLLFIIGIYFYYLWYYPLLLPVFESVLYYLKVPIKLFFLVFSQFISIIRILIEKARRRFDRNNDNGTKEENG